MIRLTKRHARYETIKKIAIVVAVVLTIVNLPDLIRYIKIETM
jgi:hypothetical protein